MVFCTFYFGGIRGYGIALLVKHPFVDGCGECQMRLAIVFACSEVDGTLDGLAYFAFPHFFAGFIEEVKCVFFVLYGY